MEEEKIEEKEKQGKREKTPKERDPMKGKYLREENPW